MIKQIPVLFFCAFLMASPFAQAAFTTATGFVTPNELTVPLRQIELLKYNDSAIVSVWKGEKDLLFKRSDSNFGKLEVGGTVVPEGRYIGVRLTMSSNFSAKITGAVYRGTNGTYMSNGATIYSVGTDALANNSVSTTQGASTLTNLRQSGVASSDTVVRTSYFPAPICFSNNAANCGATDYKIVQTGSDRRAGASVTAPEMNLVMDLFNALQVDASNGAVAFGYSFPIPVMGTPGALIHIASSGQSNFSLVFSGDKQIQAIVANGVQSAASLNGTANVRVISAPQTIPTTGELFVASFDSTTGSGTLRFPLSTAGTANCYLELSNVLTSVGNAVSVSVNSSQTTITGSGYTWSMSNSCGSSSAGSVSVQRIIDPNNIFGLCTAGLCAASGTDADGYL